MTRDLDEAKQLILASQGEVERVESHLTMLKDFLDELMGSVCLADALTDDTAMDRARHAAEDKA